MAMEMASSRWRLQFDPASGAYECTHLNSGLVLDLEGGRGEPGTNIITYPAHGGQNQRWKIEQLDQGSLSVQSVQRPNLYMTAITDNSHYIINVIGGERTTSPRARWHFRKV
ncbi:uncharacterized protein LAJ45_05116 [Morchella importuna]|uniref:Lectin n=1 Tax=Morchella importuna TaxID=1174673 RepID=A0A7G5KLU9_9PEZI|nr:uncharacterized protein LAJ45_05116 [Morchella importuna]KAH8150934.1 hypothetical protein LAJ45_05116 [Morchella importuna]QMW48841.1 lectin [Morchella importuna]